MKKVIEPGSFELQIGSASDDIRIRKTVDYALEKNIPDSNEKDKDPSQKAADAL